MRLESPMPRPGDLSICYNCGTLNQFDKELKLVLMSNEEIKRLPRDQWAEICEMTIVLGIAKGNRDAMARMKADLN